MPKRPAQVEAILGEHLNLCVAAHLARTQLVPDPRARYDADHLMEMVETVGQALTRVATLYARENGGPPRELTAGELDGARVSEGATLVVLKDGRTLSSVSIKRADLRQAIAILKAVGIPWPASVIPPSAEPAAASAEDLLVRLTEVEELLQRNESLRAGRLLIAIARQARDGRVANLAMRLMSAIGGSSDIHPLLARLRAALAQAERSKS